MEGHQFFVWYKKMVDELNSDNPRDKGWLATPSYTSNVIFFFTMGTAAREVLLIFFPLHI